jgi:hypothetical protein
MSIVNSFYHTRRSFYSYSTVGVHSSNGKRSRGSVIQFVRLKSQLEDFVAKLVITRESFHVGNKKSKIDQFLSSFL